MVFRKDRSFSKNKRKLGGGVATFVRSTLHYTEQPSLDNTEVEHQIIRIKLGRAYYTFVNVYLQDTAKYGDGSFSYTEKIKDKKSIRRSWASGRF